MTEEQVKKGKELLAKLEKLKDNKKLWESAVQAWRVALTYKYDYVDASSIFDVTSSYIDFDKLKKDTLANIDRLIQETQREFDNL
jgi:hypothetical protein|nr:MAG TPA: hypothetical protein [Crassvirales sp.]